jgi:adenosylhomocysteine nucleosidase
MRREAQAFRRRFRPRERFPGAPFPARLHRRRQLNVLLVETGIGLARTETALTWLLGKPLFANVPYRPRFVVSAGFSGALRAGLSVGDVVLATEVSDVAGNHWHTTLPLEPKSPLWHRGRLLSTPRLAGSAHEKEALGKQYDVVAADMETAAVARICSRLAVPFGIVRAISDDVQTGLSQRLVTLFSGSRVSVLRALAAVAATPSMMPEMWRLARNTRTAGRKLATALCALLEPHAHFAS